VVTRKNHILTKARFSIRTGRIIDNNPLLPFEIPQGILPPLVYSAKTSAGGMITQGVLP
jgi:hypothetical protein